MLGNQLEFKYNDSSDIKDIYYAVMQRVGLYMKSYDFEKLFGKDAFFIVVFTPLNLDYDSNTLNVDSDSNTLAVSTRSCLRLNKNSFVKSSCVGVRYFSSDRKENGFKDNVLSVWLPNLTDKNIFSKELIGLLDKYCLDQRNFVYKFYYALFLHTNDKSCISINFEPSENGMLLDISDLNKKECNLYKKSLDNLNKNFKFHGYCVLNISYRHFYRNDEYFVYTAINRLDYHIRTINYDSYYGYINIYMPTLLEIERRPIGACDDNNVTNNYTNKNITNSKN